MQQNDEFMIKIFAAIDLLFVIHLKKLLKKMFFLFVCKVFVSTVWKLNALGITIYIYLISKWYDSIIKGK